MKMLKLFKIIFVLNAFLLMSGCGVYGFRGNNPPKGINTLAVPTAEDISGFSAPTLPETFTERLKIRITTDNTFKIADKNISDGVLNCTITSVTDEASVIATGDNVTQRKLTITIKVSFDDLKKQKQIWEKNFQNYGEYASNGNDFSNRESGVAIAIEKIAEDIVIDLTSNW
ncbi:MAG TPA: LPS assembly lipoprotein LptE [Ignavibacteria bacterium]|nr:LPS assembly lipoprotein LptE [Ignavibacteria bacterium]HRB00211.1 LPS assembly lipoprotein LptE [Ignavibacteria bacterium]